MPVFANKYRCGFQGQFHFQGFITTGNGIVRKSHLPKTCCFAAIPPRQNRCIFMELVCQKHGHGRFTRATNRKVANRNGKNTCRLAQAQHGKQAPSQPGNKGIDIAKRQQQVCGNAANQAMQRYISKPWLS